MGYLIIKGKKIKVTTNEFKLIDKLNGYNMLHRLQKFNNVNFPTIEDSQSLENPTSESPSCVCY